MVSMRDSQRQKVYRAESKYDYEAGIERVNADFADEIIGCLADTFKVKKPEVAVNRKLRRVAGQYTGWQNLIEFSSNTPRLSVVTHEFAHHLARERTKGQNLYGLRAHGGGFTEAMLDVTEDIVGTADRKILNSAYIDKNVLVGLKPEIDHVAANQQKQYGPAQRRDQEEGKVLVVQKQTLNGTLYHAGVDSFGDNYTTVRWYARGYRYPKAAEKAGKRLWGEDFEIVEVDGYYDAYKKHWVPN